MSEYKLKTGKLGEKIVNAYKGIEDKFVDTFLEEDGSLKTGGMAEKATSAYQLSLIHISEPTRHQ